MGCGYDDTRDNAARWEMIAPVLRAGESVLDLGTHDGWMARAAHDHGADVTAVDSCDVTVPPGVAVVPALLTPAALARMPRFDVTLALSVLHHFADWRAALAQVRACRRRALVEVPHPGERAWMRSAPARDDLAALEGEVARHGYVLGTSVRRGRDGKDYERSLYSLPGTVTQLVGAAFTGSGSASRNLSRGDVADRLARALGVRSVYPGSLNLRFGDVVSSGVKIPEDLGPPLVEFRGYRGRDYQLWRAWIGATRVWAMVPGNRGHGEDVVEVVASVPLRDRLGIADGDPVPLDVETR